MCISIEIWSKKAPLRPSIFVGEIFQNLSVSSILTLLMPYVSLGIVSDPQEGILIESFEYKTTSGFQFTVVSDS